MNASIGLVAESGIPYSNTAEISRCVSEINPFGCCPRVNGSDYNNYYTPSPFEPLPPPIRY